MITVAVYNEDGKQIDSLNVDEAMLGGRVRHSLLKQAIVMYHANKRQGTATTKSRGMVEGSTKKIYRQKGTGNARMGTIRQHIRRGGGVAFAKVVRDFGKDMPKKQRQLATDSAILSKLQKGNVVVVDRFKFEQPKTKNFVRLLENLKIDRSCLVAVNETDRNIYKSARNVPKVAVIKVTDLNAGDICNMQKMLFAKDAFLAVIEKNKESNRAR
ncbi:MAG: 50S ribosomal protein L4 [Planctomycetes bacterium RBG_13_44_8b]|nr:MAG: 50S ribosomal protein L4 [Planctomycetes bacterium RBG_13_44_8b]